LPALKSSKLPSLSSRSVVESEELSSSFEGCFSSFVDVMQSTPSIELLAVTNEEALPSGVMGAA
jgi:hypothetical protein